MRGTLMVVALVLAGCMTGGETSPDPGPELERLDNQRCQMGLRGCFEANERAAGTCTFCAPIGTACNATFTPTCGLPDGHGWCTDGTCRSFCSGFPYCETGFVPEYRPSSSPHKNVCVCVPG